jgi:uroporphyrinogen decarboxylase
LNGYERIKANINFTGPDRIGLRFDRIENVSDVCRIFVLPPNNNRDKNKKYSVSKKVRPASGEYDEWGCLWESEDATGSDMGQVVNIPIDDWDNINDYNWPDPKAEGRFDGLEEALNDAEEKGLYVQLNSPQCIFERMHFLRGFEDTLMDCMCEPELIEEMAKNLANYQIGIIEEAARLGKGRIHCYDTTDDWGTQSNLMIPPEVFREIFKPQYKRVFDKAHECGMDVRLHTDGKINSILPDFIELGVDILNIHQPRLVGIDEVSEIAQGKICFEAAIDIQSTLPTGDLVKIEEEAKELCMKWATPMGGLIGVEYGYLSAIGTTKESMLYALEMFKKYGTFKGE